MSCGSLLPHWIRLLLFPPWLYHTVSLAILYMCNAHLHFLGLWFSFFHLCGILSPKNGMARFPNSLLKCYFYSEACTGYIFKNRTLSFPTNLPLSPYVCYPCSPPHPRHYLTAFNIYYLLLFIIICLFHWSRRYIREEFWSFIYWCFLSKRIVPGIQ